MFVVMMVVNLFAVKISSITLMLIAGLCGLLVYIIKEIRKKGESVR